MSLAKSVVSDGEGATKFIEVNILNCKKDSDAKKIAFSVCNSPLVKTAINGEDPNWGRIIMAIGKANVNLNVKKIGISFGKIKIVENGELNKNYNENNAKDYMKNEKIEITINIGNGSKSFTAYTMDFSKKYLEINGDYRT